MSHLPCLRRSRREYSEDIQANRGTIELWVGAEQPVSHSAELNPLASGKIHKELPGNPA